MNTGGPAFPQKSLPYSTEDKKGMTLRDYFAAKAMQAIFSNPDITDTEKVKNWIAISSYSMADAMLEARKK